MKIAFIGTRGVPASYSGFETCVEELGSRLARRGHEVTAYCRPHHVHYPLPAYRGMRLVKLPTLQNKYLDTIVHAAISSLHALTQGYDIAFYCIAGNSPVAWIPRIAGQRTAINVDGLDWKREKWPRLAKKYLQWTERIAGKTANVVVTDSRAVQRFYREHYGTETTYIAYGASAQKRPPGTALQKFGLEPRRYILFVGRLVPENAPHHLIDAFDDLDTDMKVVIVGDAPYAEEYIASIRSTDDPRIVFTGYQFGEAYQELSSHAYAFVETSGVGGTHPALVEQMAFGNCVVVNDTEENLETIGDAGLSYHSADGGKSLRQVLADLLSHPEKVEAYRAKAAERAAQVYDWERVTDAYESLFLDMLGGEG